jgi:endonuclease/exonuclease/phosphatase family metal-dependent hydrolase
MFKTITRGSFVLINILISIPMLLLYLLPYLGISSVVLLNLFSLAFPYLLLSQIVFIFFWLLLYRRFIWIPLLTLLFCTKLIFSLIGFHPFNHKQDAANNNFRIASWNVHLFDFFDHGGRPNASMFQYVQSFKADVLCAQEVIFSLDASSPFSLDNMKRRMGFKYAYAGNDRAFGVHSRPGSASGKQYFPFCLVVFSNFPILQTKKIQPLREYNHTFIWTDLLIGKDTVRVMNVHLQSLHFVKKDYDLIERIDQHDASFISNRGQSLLRKMKEANLQRAIQAMVVRDEIRKSPHPVVLCGDMNDVPNSYAYQLFRKDLGDAFSDKGFGIGRTFLYLAPTLRLDYIFYDRALSLNAMNVAKEYVSDHRPLLASFDLPSSP